MQKPEDLHNSQVDDEEVPLPLLLRDMCYRRPSLELHFLFSVVFRFADVKGLDCIMPMLSLSLKYTETALR